MFKKTIAIILALALGLSAATVFAYAEEVTDSPEASESKSVKVEFIYVPLKSRIVIGKFGPLFHGTVIRVTYPDGTSESLTVKKTDNGYIAGDFTVDWSFFLFEFEALQGTVINYGIANGVFGIHNDNGYSGGSGFYYLNLPSPAELVYVFNYLYKLLIKPLF